MGLCLAVGFGLWNSADAPPVSATNGTSATPGAGGTSVPAPGSVGASAGGAAPQAEASRLGHMDPTELDKSVAGEEGGAARGAAPARQASSKGSWFVGEVGTYLVGRGMPPGTYASAGGHDGRTCQWHRLKGLGGTPADVVASGSGSGRTVVTILATDAFFQTKDCANWQKVS
jgi:hypothetical protein